MLKVVNYYNLKKMHKRSCFFAFRSTQRSISDDEVNFYFINLVAFEDCCKGRTVSVVWSCRKENNAMKQCMSS